MSSAWHKALSRESSRHLLLVTSACLDPTHSSFLSALPFPAFTLGPLHRSSTWRPNLAFKTEVDNSLALPEILQWIPVCFEIKSKCLGMADKALNDLAPA